MNFMIDLETLDTKDSAIIIAIGVVAFDNEFSTKNQQLILVDFNKSHGTTSASVDTCLFWFKQLRKTPEMLDLFKGDQKEDDALQLLSEFIEENADVSKNRYWSKGSFDFNILNHRFAGYNMKTPWRFNELRDARTIINLPRDELFPTVELPQNNNLHDPISDCLNQIEQMKVILKRCN